MQCRYNHNAIINIMQYKYNANININTMLIQYIHNSTWKEKVNTIAKQGQQKMQNSIAAIKPKHYYTIH